MSVLECPVCRGAMREVSRADVLIDVCSQCRGVWLDRGELEKLAQIVDDRRPSGLMPRPVARPPRDRDDRDLDDDRWQGRAPYSRKPKSKTARLLDFFD